MSGKAVVGAEITVNKTHHTDLRDGELGFPWKFQSCRLNFQKLCKKRQKEQEGYGIHGQLWRKIRGEEASEWFTFMMI